MDFDVVLDDEMEEQVGQEPSVHQQFARLGHAIERLEQSGYLARKKAKVSLFIGFDLRKLNTRTTGSGKP